jgi:hypothetical protein
MIRFGHYWNWLEKQLGGGWENMHLLSGVPAY